MNTLIRKLFAVAGGSSTVVGSVSATAALAGLIYMVDCRITAGLDFEKANSCYLSGLPMMGLGLGVGGGWRAGYETYNPHLRPPEDEDEDDEIDSEDDKPLRSKGRVGRDSHGRFTRRKDR